MKFLFLSLIALLTTSIALADIVTEAEANIIDDKNHIVGNAVFLQGNDGIVIRMNVKGLKPGFHGLHFHEVGDCSDFSKGFKKSGDHLTDNNDEEHGFLSENGPHPADLPNLYVHKDGTGIAEFYAQTISLDGQDFKKELLDFNGSSILIHENEDDHYTQPSGNSGKRIACGVIVAK